MKKLTKEETSKLITLRGRTTRLAEGLATLEPGESLIIYKEIDWVGKMPPYRLIHRFAKRTGLKFKAGRTPDQKGWVAIRME